MLDDCAICQKALLWWPFVVTAAASIINGLLNHYGDKKGLVKTLNVILDILSFTTRSNSPGTIKLPMTTSKMS